MKKSILAQASLIVSLLFAQISFGQNVGINATNPQATLDINGSFRIRPLTLEAVANVINVPDNAGYIIITRNGGQGTVTINASEAHIGRRLVIDNTNALPAVLGSVLITVPQGVVTEYIVSPTEPGWIRLGEIGSIPNPLYLSSSGTTITGESNQADESGILGINTSSDVAIGVKGVTTATNPTENSIAVYGLNLSQNENGTGVYGTHAGTGWAGAFYGTNALKATGATELAGNVRINGEIKPGGVAGTANQVLKSNGNGTMSWGANPSNWISQGDDIFNANYGNVGIGTDQPIEKLDVIGNVAIDGLLKSKNLISYTQDPLSENVNSFLLFKANNTTTGRISAIGNDNTTARMGFFTGAVGLSERLTINDNGFVGINNNQPESQFDVGGDGHFQGQLKSRGLSIYNNNPLATDITANLWFGGKDYTTGRISTIGTGTSSARLGLFTGYSFPGSPFFTTNERLSILNNGKIGINQTNPGKQLSIIGDMEIKGANGINVMSVSNIDNQLFSVGADGVQVMGPINSNLLTVKNTAKDLMVVTNNGIQLRTDENIAEAPVGTSLINTNSTTQLGKWGYESIGVEIFTDDLQVPFATMTKIPFDSPVFEHDNRENGFGNRLINITNDVFIAPANGIYLIDFEIKWTDQSDLIGGAGLRNGKIRIDFGNGYRDIKCDEQIKDHMYAKLNSGSQISILAYHEHCLELPPLCLNGVKRDINFARVTIIKI